MFDELFERTRRIDEEALPDWVSIAIERYLQAFEAGEVEGARGVEDAAVSDVIDFIVSTNPDKELTDELRAAAMKEIESYGVGYEIPDTLRTDLATTWEEEEPELSADAEEQIEIGMGLLHDKYDYDVDKTVDFLMSDIVRNLSPEEWKEVERQLNQYVEDLGESKKDED